MKLRDRIKDFRRVPVGEIEPHPANWRTHPEAQRDALRGLLAEVGIADALLCYEPEPGHLRLLDGHLRAEVTPDTEWPILVLDVTEDEARKLLATHDPLVDMAEADGQKLGELVTQIDSESEAIRAMLDGLTDAGDLDDVKLRQIDVHPPPAMTWVLLGLPTVRFGEIAAEIDRLAQIEGILLESTSNDG